LDDRPYAATAPWSTMISGAWMDARMQGRHPGPLPLLLAVRGRRPPARAGRGRPADDPRM